MKTGTKSIKFNGLKVSPARPDQAQLELINKFTRRTFTADELYIGQLRLAHNAVDRDGERFSEEVLQRFLETAVRKTLLFDHAKYDSRDNAVGKFFVAEMERIPLQEAQQELGEKLWLPEGLNEVMVLSPFFYIPVKGVSEETIVKIDAGIYDFASIGFSAENLVPVFDKEGAVLYREYRGSGTNTEVREGSLVYLGAQQGMAVKSADGKAVLWNETGARQRVAKWASSDGSGDKDRIDWIKYGSAFAFVDTENPEDFGSYRLLHHDVVDGELCVIWEGVSAAAALCGTRGGPEKAEHHLFGHYKQFDREPPTKAADNKGGTEQMKDFIKIMARLFPGQAFSEENLGEEIKAAMEESARIAVEKATGPLNAKITELTALAADGRAYRDDLIGRYITSKAKLGEVAETPEAQGKVKAVAEAYPIDFLKTEVDVLHKRVAEKFPEAPQTKGDERRDKSAGEGDNELVPAEEG